MSSRAVTFRSGLKACVVSTKWPGQRCAREVENPLFWYSRGFIAALFTHRSSAEFDESPAMFKSYRNLAYVVKLHWNGCALPNFIIKISHYLACLGIEGHGMLPPKKIHS